MIHSVLDPEFDDKTRTRLWDAVADLPLVWSAPLSVPQPSRGTGGNVWDGFDPDRSARAILGGAPRCMVTVSPGVIRLSRSRPPGFVRRIDQSIIDRGISEVAHHVEVLVKRERDGCWWESYREEHEHLTAIEDVWTRLGVSRVSAKRGRSRGCIEEWSERSRSRMVRTFASLDWELMADQSIAMVTLTYPDRFLDVVPNGRTAKRHLKAFRSAWERKTVSGELDGPGRIAGALWKLEFQRRGAPHFHLLMPVPAPSSRFGYRHASGEVEQVSLQRWARLTWARIVGAQGVDRARHEAAGVSIDWAEGGRYSDPKRIGIYFSKHGAPGKSSKDYQHRVPQGWTDDDGDTDVGRWWGYWRLQQVGLEAEISAADHVEYARILRGWIKAQRRQVAVQVPSPWLRSSPDGNGEIRWHRRPGRWSHRRYSHRGLTGVIPSGFVVVNDAPRLARAISRALRVSCDHPPGARRNLP